MYGLASEMEIRINTLNIQPLQWHAFSILDIIVTILLTINVLLRRFVLSCDHSDVETGLYSLVWTSEGSKIKGVYEVARIMKIWINTLNTACITYSRHNWYNLINHTRATKKTRLIFQSFRGRNWSIYW